MQLTFEPLENSWFLVAGLIAVLVMSLVWFSPRGLPARRRNTLLMLRVVAAVVLILMLLRPSLVRRDNRPTSATIAIAIDTSRSMTLASGERPADGLLAGIAGGDGEATRWAQQAGVLKRLADELGPTDSESLQLQWIVFDEQGRMLAQAAPGTTDASGTVESLLQSGQPDGRVTDLATGLRAALDAGSSQPLAGVILLSDGTQTVRLSEGAESDAVEDPRAPSRLLAAMGVPLWTVPLGPPSEAVLSRDVAVESLPETYRMFAGNETEVGFEVALRGVAGRPVEVTLQWEPADGPVRTAAERTVQTGQSSETVGVRVPVLAPEPGRYRLTARAEAVDGETILGNNDQVAFVEVSEGGGRVLYLEGSVRLEQTYLRRALRRFPDLQLTYRWIPRDTADQWPIDLGTELSRRRVDVVVLGDLHAAALGDDQLEQLAEAVRSGVALVTLGGEHGYGPGGYADSPLAQVLPVRMNADLRQPPGLPAPPSRSSPAGSGGAGTDAAAVRPGQIERPIRLEPTTAHPVTTIQPSGPGGPTVAEAWQQLPPQPGANQWVSPKVAPGVQVLLADQADAPMMVVGEYGRGRVASLAFDSTWQWWRGGQDEFHRRFWRQLMLWLLSREETDDRSIDLRLDQRRFATSESPSFEASWTRSADTSDGRTPRWTAEIITEDGGVLPVTGQIRPPSSGEAARWNLEGTLPDLPAGFHTLRVSVPDGRGEPASETPPGGSEGEGNSQPRSAEVAFQVIDDTRELAVSQTDHPLLRQLSSLTRDAGGRSYRPDQVDELVEEIQSRQTAARAVVIQRSRLGDGPLSGWILFVLFTASMSFQWWLRRRWGLA